jgi:hypothetical protein
MSLQKVAIQRKRERQKLSRCGENAAKKQSEIIAENCVQLCRAQWAEGVVEGGGGQEAGKKHSCVFK